jgi:hypothetical protein
MLSSIYSNDSITEGGDLDTISNISFDSIVNYPLQYDYSDKYRSYQALITDTEGESNIDTKGDHQEIDTEGNILDYYINADLYKKHVGFASYNRIFFDIQQSYPCYYLQSKLKIFLLKRKYKKELTKNIFLSKYSPNKDLYQLFEQLNSNELTIFYRFETWHEFSNIFGWYNGFLFYTVGSNLHIDYIAEYLPNSYLKYILKLKNEVIGNVYYIEKFTITKDTNGTNKDSIFTLINNISKEFFNRN